MKIESLTTRNFMKLGTVHLDLTGSVTHLFCGPNESGKSSIKDAVRMAFIGTSPRVKLKKEHGLLVTDGRKKGRVGMRIRAEAGAEPIDMYRNVDSEGAVHPKDFKFDEYSVQCLDFALQIRSFADAKEDERRKLLGELLTIKMSSDEVCRRLAEDHKVTESYVKSVKPLLRTGFDAACKDATLKKANARATWCAITGESWGDEKVKTWAPAEDGELAVVSDEQMHASQASVQALDDQIEALVRQETSLQANGDSRARLMAERDAVLELKANRPKLRAERTQVVLRLQTATDTIEESQRRLALIEQAQHVLSCPNCDSKLRLQNNELTPISIEDTDTGAGDGENKGLLQKALQDAQRALTTDGAKLMQLNADIQKATVADTRITEIDIELSKIGQGVDIEEVRGQITAHKAKRADASVEHGKLHAAHSATARRQTDNKKAADAVVAYFEWDKIVAALSPDGIPAKILLEQIQPLNLRLEQTAALAGWERVQLNENMELVRDTPNEKRTYPLLSESAQWRMSACMAEAISSMSGMRILVLDRMDVLTAGEQRKQCMEWLSKLAKDEYDTILVFATMATKPPAEAVYGAQVHWVQDVIRNQSVPDETK